MRAAILVKARVTRLPARQRRQAGPCARALLAAGSAPEERDCAAEESARVNPVTAYPTALTGRRSDCFFIVVEPSDAYGFKASNELPVVIGKRLIPNKARAPRKPQRRRGTRCDERSAAFLRRKRSLCPCPEGVEMRFPGAHPPCQRDVRDARQELPGRTDHAEAAHFVVYAALENLLSHFDVLRWEVCAHPFVSPLFRLRQPT